MGVADANQPTGRRPQRVHARGPVSEGTSRFFTDARLKAGTADRLGELLEPLLGRRYNRKTIAGWGQGPSDPGSDVMLATIAALGMDPGPYLPSVARPPSIDERVARLEGYVDQLSGGLGVRDAIVDDANQAPAESVPNLRALEERMAEILEELRRLRQRGA